MLDQPDLARHVPRQSTVISQFRSKHHRLWLAMIVMFAVALASTAAYPLLRRSYSATTTLLLYHEAVTDYNLRHTARPGVADWAQIQGWRGETINAHQIEQRVLHDFGYINRQSLLFESLILILTVRAVWRRDSYY